MRATVIGACTLVVATLASNNDNGRDLYAHTGSREEYEHDAAMIDNMHERTTAFVASKKTGNIKKIEYGMSEANTEDVMLSDRDAEDMNAKLALNHQKRLTLQAAHKLRLKHGYSTDSPGYVDPCSYESVHGIKEEMTELQKYEHPTGFRPQLKQRLDELKEDLQYCGDSAAPPTSLEKADTRSEEAIKDQELVKAPPAAPKVVTPEPVKANTVAAFQKSMSSHEMQLKDELVHCIDDLHAANAKIDKLQLQNQETEGVVLTEDQQISQLHADKVTERQQHISEVQVLEDKHKTAIGAKQAELQAKKAEMQAREEEFAAKMKAREAEFAAKTKELKKAHEEKIQQLTDGLKAEKESALLEMQCKHKDDLLAQLNYDTIEKHAIHEMRSMQDKMLADMAESVQRMQERLSNKVTELESKLPTVTSEACHTDEDSSMEEEGASDQADARAR